MVEAEQDWRQWSRDAVALMKARNREFIAKFSLANSDYRWNLAAGELAFPSAGKAVVADLCVIGSSSAEQGTFFWAWANKGVPETARRRLAEVRAFGEAHDLPLLTTAEWRGGRSEGMEMLAVAGRILDAEGVMVVQNDDLTLFFALHRFRSVPSSTVAWLAKDERNSE